MDNICKALGLAGCTMADICKATVLLEDARDFGRFNAVYAACFEGAFPVRTTSEARLMGSFLVEIDVIAYAPR
jgi:2-iminobutanoate/2-iminopropanoate deaminase